MATHLAERLPFDALTSVIKLQNSSTSTLPRINLKEFCCFLLSDGKISQFAIIENSADPVASTKYLASIGIDNKFEFKITFTNTILPLSSN